MLLGHLCKPVRAEWGPKTSPRPEPLTDAAAARTRIRPVLYSWQDYVSHTGHAPD